MYDLAISKESSTLEKWKHTSTQQSEQEHWSFTQKSQKLEIIHEPFSEWMGNLRAGQSYNRILLGNYREQVIHVVAWKGVSRTLCSYRGWGEQPSTKGYMPFIWCSRKSKISQWWLGLQNEAGFDCLKGAPWSLFWNNESCFMWCYKVFEFIDSSAKN